MRWACTMQLVPGTRTAAPTVSRSSSSATATVRVNNEYRERLIAVDSFRAACRQTGG